MSVLCYLHLKLLGASQFYIASVVARLYLDRFCTSYLIFKLMIQHRTKKNMLLVVSRSSPGPCSNLQNVVNLKA
uniref:Uncharacterized protein n=1 Tax=Arundo donax TaxID=35708 RepID=A0A0A9HGI8_ARUDO